LLSAIAIGVFVLGLLVGWKLRGYWDKRPRILGGKPKPAAPSKDGKPGTGGIVDRLSGVGEKIVKKGVETIIGKPKGPKDDKEEK
jgi:hypothetical protein